MAGIDYSQEYFTIEALSNGVISCNNRDSVRRVYYYKINDGEWVSSATSVGISISVTSGDIVRFKVNGNMPPSFGGTSCSYNVYGNVMSLLYGDYFGDKYAISGTTTFSRMFYYGGVVDAGGLCLPATSLTEQCYEYMFYECTGLTTAPSVLPATTLQSRCYRSMFSHCTSLTTAPELPATTLAEACYDSMFAYCTGLTAAPDLPATTLASACYIGMFQNCSSLTTAPDLPAPTLMSSCYDGMFVNCSRLNYIKCLAADDNIYCSSWVYGVASTGTFVKAEGITGWTIGMNGIPEGWEVEEEQKYPNSYLTFRITSGTGGTIKWKCVSSAFTSTISYSKDNGATWHSITSNTGNSAPTIYVNIGDAVIFKGENKAYSISSLYEKDFSYFELNTICAAEGNIMSLLYGDNFSGQTELPQESGFTFSGLFRGNAGLTSAKNLILPATELTNGCYAYMFQDCSNLTEIPELPATTMVESCYYGMFSRCSKLTTPPLLPATTLAEFCYSFMFGECSDLLTAPELPVMTLADSCYDSMFWKCVSLTTAPELPATELVHRCYFYMFAYCSSLSYIKCMAISGIDTDYNTVSWVNTVNDTGTFIKNSGATWSVGDNGIPDNWTVQVA